MDTLKAKALVLVIEDNEDVRNIITLYLRRNGFAIAEAGDGVAGVEAAQKLQPDLILLDVLLPRLDGLEVLRRLRETEWGRKIPVVMMSAVLQIRDLKSETSRLNVSSFLEKPFQTRAIMHHVEAALGFRKSLVAENLNRVASARPSVSWGGEDRLQYVRRELARSGSLEEFALPEILHSVFVGSHTGRLRLSAGTTEKRIFFQNGIPVYAESSLADETLGFHLLSSERITEEEHESAREEMTRSGRHFGEVILSLGFLGPHELFKEIESHLTYKVISAFGWQSGVYEFEDGDSWKDDIIVARMKPGRILLDGLQRFWTPGQVQKKLGITDFSKTFPLDRSPHTEEVVGFSTQETRILQMVRRGLTVGDLVRQIKDLNLTISTLYGLYIMEHLGFVLDGKALSQTGPFPVAGRSVNVTLEMKEERSKALLAEYLRFRTADYFQILGVSRGATNEEVTSAFEKRQKRYHPDGLVGIDSGLIHDKMEELYIRVHNAYRTLIDPESRRRYLKQLDEKVQGAPIISRSKTSKIIGNSSRSEDAEFFEKGYSLLRSGEYESARQMFEKAEEIKSKPRYQAYVAWSGYLANPEQEKAKTERTLAGLQKDNPDDALFAYLLGNLALKEKSTKRAVSHFEQAVRADPRHIDSARQLRLLKMREKNENTGVFRLKK